MENQTETSSQIPSIQDELNIRPQSSRFMNNPITQYLSKPLGASRRKTIDQQVLKNDCERVLSLQYC